MSLLPCQKDLFSLPDEVSYLNCAYMSPLMQAVVEAGNRANALKATPWKIQAKDFFNISESVRGLFAGLVGVGGDDIALIPAVSYAAAIAARNIPFHVGDEILILADQFPSNVYPWQALARRREGKIVTVEAAPESLSDAVTEAITEKTALLALPHCRWTDGALLDLVQIAEVARQKGAALFLDLTQSAGALPVDLKRIQPDFAVAAGYKWLMGPYTLGYLYVSPRYQEDGEPLEENWIARENSENFADLIDYRQGYQPGARRFDMGERSNFHLLPMAEIALQKIREWGISNIAATLTSFNGNLLARAAPLGFTALPAQCRAGHYLGLLAEREIPRDIAEKFAREKVYVSLRGKAIRVTPHLYNDARDRDRFISLLETLPGM